MTISNTSQRAVVSASLLRNPKHMFWKTEDIIQCHLIYANSFPLRNLWFVGNTHLAHLQNTTAFTLLIICIAVTPCMLYCNCYFVVDHEPMAARFNYVKLLPTWNKKIYLYMYVWWFVYSLWGHTHIFFNRISIYCNSSILIICPSWKEILTFQCKYHTRRYNP